MAMGTGMRMNEKEKMVVIVKRGCSKKEMRLKCRSNLN